MPTTFTKPFTQQEPLPPEAIARITEILQTGRLHRYNVIEGEAPEASLLETDYAAYQGAKYCLAVTSGGQAMQIALRAAGLKPGDKVLTNAYTLAPVPGAIHATGGIPILIDTTENWHIDLDHLEREAPTARILMLSLMRGHIPDMTRIMEIATAHNLTVIEDCAHTMGARWQGTRSGNFGQIACFSTQTYKHINSGEGGLLTTNDPDIAARAIVTSGSYMLYTAHGAAPPEDAFQRNRLHAPNCSARMDNLRAALIRAQLPLLEANITRWNSLYQTLQTGLSQIPGLHLPPRAQHEAFVGSSIQFHVKQPTDIPSFIAACAQRGVDIKWFGAEEPKAFTSRYDSWHYLQNLPDLHQTKTVLSTTCDMRIPLTFTEEDCTQITRIVGEVLAG